MKGAPETVASLCKSESGACAPPRPDLRLTACLRTVRFVPEERLAKGFGVTFPQRGVGRGPARPHRVDRRVASPLCSATAGFPLPERSPSSLGLAVPQDFSQELHQFTSSGFRVLGLAYKPSVAVETFEEAQNVTR